MKIMILLEYVQIIGTQGTNAGAALATVGKTVSFEWKCSQSKLTRVL